MASSLSGRVAYIATAKIIDEEMKKRVSQHKRRRPGSWKTYEIKSMQVKVGDIDKILSDIKLEEINTILIDCLTNLLFRIIDRYNLDNIEIINNRVEKEIEKKVTLFFKTILSRLKSSNLNVIIISNEVGMGVVPAFPLGRIFRDLMGIVNKEAVLVSDEVYLFVAGLKQRLK